MSSKYSEKQVNVYSSVIILVATFIIIYAPLQLGDRLLSSREGCYAAMAVEGNSSSFLPVSVAQGEIMSGYYPLYPQIASLVNKFGVPVELNLRFISVVSLFLLVIGVWIVGRKAVSPQAGIVAAAMMLTTIIVSRKAIDGYPHILAFLLIFSAWMSWFTYGAVKRRWNMAWISFFLFCGLAFYTIGWNAVVSSVLPYVFLRRPLTVWRKLKFPGVIVGLSIIIAFILLWAVPAVMLSAEMHVKSADSELLSFAGYWEHLYKFPFNLAGRFMPWTFLAWAPFCVALFRVDENPVFSRYLRTIVISLFVFMWLNPFYDSRDVLLLVAPLSVLTGSYYWILVRRYTRQFYYIFRTLSFVGIVGSIAVVLFFLVPEAWLDLFTFRHGLGFREPARNLGLIKAGASLAICVYFFALEHRNIVLWRHIVGIVVAYCLCQWGVAIPYNSQSTSKERFAATLKEAIIEEGDYSPDLLVYKDINIGGLYSECYYLGCRVKRISSLDDLPAGDKEVYLISTRPPLLVPGREWKPLLPKGTQYKSTVVYLWKGVSENQGDSNAR